ncbi:LOW QUALITY PROTEIN: Gag protein [Phytophthora palmivora]|uniref:Gag protein n=1 Tax=Phytophthora palmivora TaxID=4796 RepID=A0A2P4WXT4_9STRA|nr:LOW QUALITY PROTEIN: Gag protein [Phytophthora palmivora]
MDRGEFPHLIDAQFESVRKMKMLSKLGGCYVGRAGRTHRGVPLAPMDERKPVQRKPLRLKVNPYEGKEGENLHFWIREVELAMGAALISTTWAYTREAITLGCFTTWAQLCQQLRAAFLPANYEYRQRSRFLACKQGKRELHEYMGTCRISAEHIKVTVFMDGLKVGPPRTQLFRVHANTMEEATQIALQEEYSHRQARTATSVWQGHNAPTGAVQGAPAAGASTGPVPMELGMAYRSPSAATEFGHMQRACPAGGQRKFPSKPKGSRGQWQKQRPKSQWNWGYQ